MGTWVQIPLGAFLNNKVLNKIWNSKLSNCGITQEVTMQNKKLISEKRICETKWHEEILLDKFQSCPRCKSEAYHLVIKNKKEEEK